MLAHNSAAAAHARAVYRAADKDEQQWLKQRVPGMR